MNEKVIDGQQPRSGRSTCVCSYLFYHFYPLGPCLHGTESESQKFKILSNSNFAPKSPRARVRCAFFLKKKTADFCDIDRAPRKRSRVHGMWNHKVCYCNRAKGNIIINVVEPGYRKLFVLHIIKLWGQKGPIPQFTLYFVLPGK